MCGIVGIVGSEVHRDPDPIAGALSAMLARGPDGLGRTLVRLGERPVALAMRRLAMVDVAGGGQPVVRPSGSVLVVNGELYRHEELRAELEARGETFRTRGDAEVLGALLETEGIAGLARVEGSYAFAYWQAPDGPLLLGRDPDGIRPLTWTRTRGGLAFASTLDALLATGLVEARPDPSAIADVLRDGVVLGSRSALVGVERLEPGEVLRFDASLHLVRLRVERPTRPSPAAEAVDPATAVLDALRAAVLDRLRLERPVAVCLSGGIDSALVASFAREAANTTAWTLTFPRHPEVDEGARARRTAERLGLPHAEVPLPADPTPWVLGAARAFDEPFADASAVPTWGLGRAVGVSARAALLGTGGDEVFGGYRRYWLLGAGPWLRHVPRVLREPVANVLDRAVPPGARLLRAASDPEGIYRGLMRLQGHEDLRRLSGALTREAPEPEPVAGPRTALDAMADDRARYLPWDLLVKEDRALMAHSVEGRHPFLDGRVARAASRLEVTGRPGRRQQKAVLRAYVREVVDPDLARVGKRGFAFPVDSLYGGALTGLAEDVLLSRRAQERGFSDPEETQRLLRDHLTGERSRGSVVHALVMLELWARRVLDRRPL